MLKLIHQLALFKDFNPAELELLTPLFTPGSCEREAVIFSQGEKADKLYFLLNGSVAVRYKPYDGPVLTITRIQAGGVFGWSALIGSDHYSSSAVCLEDSQVLCVCGAELRSLCQQHPVIGAAILDRLAEMVSARWQNSHEQVKLILAKGMAAKTNGLKGDDQMTTGTTDHGRQERLQSLLDQLSAYVEQFHGGSVEFVSLEDNVLKVRLGGACLGCPLSPSTLHGWVAGTVHQFFPEIEVVAEE
jgi:CRP-like cAMP-binding protein